MDFLNIEEECNCQGPGAGCFICSPSSTLKETSDVFIREVHNPMFKKIMEDDLTIKVKWIQQVTSQAVLVRTKKEWFWIPLSLVVSLKSTNKGWKLKVKSYFKKSPITVDVHHYFEKQEYES